MREKEIKIQWEGKERIVKIRQLDFVEQNKLYDSTEKTTLPNGETVCKPGEFRINTMIKSIKDAPFEISLKGLKEVDPGVAEMIYQEIDKLNRVDDKKKQN